MVTRTVIIDLEDAPELTEFVHKLAGTDAPVIFRENGKDIVEIRVVPEDETYPSALDPIDPALLEVIRYRRENKPTPADIAEAKSAAGGWADIDTDQLKRDIYEDRERNAGRYRW